MEAAETFDSNLFCAAFVLLIQFPPQLKAVLVFAPDHVEAAVVWAMGAIAQSRPQEAPELSRYPWKVESNAIDASDFGEKFERHLDTLLFNKV